MDIIDSLNSYDLLGTVKNRFRLNAVLRNSGFNHIYIFFLSQNKTVTIHKVLIKGYELPLICLNLFEFSPAIVTLQKNKVETYSHSLTAVIKEIPVSKEIVYTYVTRNGSMTDYLAAIETLKNNLRYNIRD